MFQGSIVAIITPMFDNGSVDYPSLQRLVEFHIEAGTHGIVAVGTTGESATLPVSEHIEVVRKVVEYVDGRIPVIAGSGANSTAEAILLSQALEKTGVDGFLSVVPYYNKPQQRGMVAHFKAVADATDLPVLLYNVPGRTVSDMLPETVGKLASHPKIIGIKEATGDISRVEAIRQLAGDDFILLSGDDATSQAFMQAGGHGVISVTANVAPKLMAEICNASAESRHEDAARIDAKLAPMHETLFIESNPVLPKYCLHKMGLIQSSYLRLPLVEGELESQKIIEQVMRDVGIAI